MFGQDHLSGPVPRRPAQTVCLRLPLFPELCSALCCQLTPCLSPFTSQLRYGEAAGKPSRERRGRSEGAGPPGGTHSALGPAPSGPAPPGPARSLRGALAAEPQLPPNEWSRLLPGRDPSPSGAPTPPGNGAGPGERADPGATRWLAAWPGSQRPRWAGTAWGARRGHFGHGCQERRLVAGRARSAARAALGGGRRRGGKEGGRQGAGRRTGPPGQGAPTRPGSARPPAARQRGREARAFCPGFTGGAPAAVSSARVFVFRWRGPGTAGGSGSGGGGSQSGRSLATAGRTPPPRATLAPFRAGPHDELRGAGPQPHWVLGNETGPGPRSCRRLCPPVCPMRSRWVGLGAGCQGHYSALGCFSWAL